MICFHNSTISIAHIGYVQVWDGDDSIGDRAFITNGNDGIWTASASSFHMSQVMACFSGTYLSWFNHFVVDPISNVHATLRPALCLIKRTSKCFHQIILASISITAWYAEENFN